MLHGNTHKLDGEKSRKKLPRSHSTWRKQGLVGRTIMYGICTLARATRRDGVY